MLAVDLQEESKQPLRQGQPAREREREGKGERERERDGVREGEEDHLPDSPLQTK